MQKSFSVDSSETRICYMIRLVWTAWISSHELNNKRQFASLMTLEYILIGLQGDQTSQS